MIDVIGAIILVRLPDGFVGGYAELNMKLGHMYVHSKSHFSDCVSLNHLKPKKARYGEFVIIIFSLALL